MGGVGLDARVFGEEKRLRPDLTKCQDSRVVEWDLPDAGNSCDPLKPCCLLLHAHVTQHYCGELGALVLAVEGDQLVGEVHRVELPERPTWGVPKTFAERRRPQLLLELLELVRGQVLQRLQDGIALLPYGSALPPLNL